MSRLAPFFPRIKAVEQFARPNEIRNGENVLLKSYLLLINGFVFSKLFYSSTVWSNTSNTNVKKLQLVQNFAGRIVLGLRKYDPISEGLKSLNRRLPIADKLLLNYF